jgi:exodeoxyribonuclease V alpha subunit
MVHSRGDSTDVALRDKTDDPAIRMKPNPETSTQEVLGGLVERVTFHNAENGFCVLRAKARGHRDLVTVVGHAATISAGEWITASGEWINDRAHGQQFKARFLKTSARSSIEGIEKYLGPGMTGASGLSMPGRWSRPSQRRCSTSSRPSRIGFTRLDLCAR